MQNRHILEWLDDDLQMHHKKDPSKDTSENEALFTGEYIVLSLALNKTIINTMPVLNTSNMVISFNNKEHISHDNLTGVVAQRYMSGLKNFFPIFSTKRMHPRDMVIYGYASKWGKLFAPFMWIPSLAMIYSCYTTFRKKPWGKELTSSGKMLALTRIIAFDMKITSKICTRLIERNPEFGSWHKVAKIYFPAEGHPIPLLVKEWEQSLK